MAKSPPRKTYEEGNKRFSLVSIRSIVADPQFRAGYRDVLAGRTPGRFFYDEKLKSSADVWGYERGRQVANWLLATGQKPPKPGDIEALVHAYRAAEAADVVL